jgi:hypothetical protein
LPPSLDIFGGIDAFPCIRRDSLSLFACLVDLPAVSWGRSAKKGKSYTIGIEDAGCGNKSGCVVVMVHHTRSQLSNDKKWRDANVRKYGYYIVFMCFMTQTAATIKKMNK